LELGLELGRYIHHERGLQRVFAIGQCVQDLLWTVRPARGVVLGETGQIAGIPPKL
jgi:hypothetical protein